MRAQQRLSALAAVAAVACAVLGGPAPTTTAAAGESTELPAGPPSAPSATPTDHAATSPLSNETTVTVWATPQRVAPIFMTPRTGAKAAGALHLYTADGFPEVYMLLSLRTEPDGVVWIHVRIPARPNGQTGWVPRTDLGAFHVTHWQLVVDRTTRTLTAYRDGKRQFSAPVGIGAPSTPTPSGHFWIREKFPIPDRSSGYWPDAFGTADYSTLSEWPGGGVVGIHGPYGQPWAIPGDPSHGCIRMRAQDVAWLYRHIPVGTALRIL
jgi:hypothetical protein